MNVHAHHALMHCNVPVHVRDTHSLRPPHGALEVINPVVSHAHLHTLARAQYRVIPTALHIAASMQQAGLPLP